jgi:hypothetical protein
MTAAAWRRRSPDELRDIRGFFLPVPHFAALMRATRGLPTLHRARIHTIPLAPRNDMRPPSRRANAPELCTNHPPAKQRARRTPGVRCTRSLACKTQKHTSVVTTGLPVSTGVPRANGFNGLFRALPGDRAFLPPSPAGQDPQGLTPASGRQDHTASPSASGALVSRAAYVHRIPHQRP